MLRTRIRILLVASIVAPLPAQHDPFEAAVARFGARLAKDVAADGRGAISAAVCVGDSLRWSNGFGWAAKGRPARPDTIYRVGSISKSITGILLAILWEKGVVGLDDPAVRHLPELATLDGSAARKAALTLRHLASHTAGLIREPRLRGAAQGPIAAWEDKVLASVRRTRFFADPGSGYQYSNIGYGILGLTLGRAGKKPFMEQVRVALFEPLGMRRTTFVVGAALRPHLAVGSVRRRDGIDTAIPAAEHAGRGYKVPNGGVYSTVEDLCRLVAALTGTAKAEAFAAKTRREILQRQTPAGDRAAYGLGFSIREHDGVRLVGHGGSVAGYTAHLVFDDASKVGVAVLRNYNRGATPLGAAASELVVELAKIVGTGR